MGRACECQFMVGRFGFADSFIFNRNFRQLGYSKIRRAKMVVFSAMGRAARFDSCFISCIFDEIRRLGRLVYSRRKQDPGKTLFAAVEFVLVFTGLISFLWWLV